MACQCNIAAHDNLFNKGILGDSADYFSTAGEVQHIIECTPDQNSIEERKKNNLFKIRNLYNWKKIIDDYEKLFLDVTRAVQQ
jgi:glycosyltransferase involved in cell wall biosynthesis